MKVLHLIKTQYGAKWAWYQINELIKLGKENNIELKFEEKQLPELALTYQTILNYRIYVEELKESVKNLDKSLNKQL